MPKIGPTPQVLALIEALRNLGIEAATECDDGHKHVDICIHKARLYIEVDGLHHYTIPKQIIADFQIDHYSDKDGFDTIRVPNVLVDTHLKPIAEAIVRVVEQRLA